MVNSILVFLKIPKLPFLFEFLHDDFFFTILFHLQVISSSQWFIDNNRQLSFLRFIDLHLKTFFFFFCLSLWPFFFFLSLLLLLLLLLLLIILLLPLLFFSSSSPSSCSIDRSLVSEYLFYFSFFHFFFLFFFFSQFSSLVSSSFSSINLLF